MLAFSINRDIQQGIIQKVYDKVDEFISSNKDIKQDRTDKTLSTSTATLILCKAKHTRGVEIQNRFSNKWGKEKDGLEVDSEGKVVTASGHTASEQLAINVANSENIIKAHLMKVFTKETISDYTVKYGYNPAVAVDYIYKYIRLGSVPNKKSVQEVRLFLERFDIEITDLENNMEYFLKLIKGLL